MKKVSAIKTKTTRIKADVFKNIYDNLDDQVSDDSYYYPWSALDSSDKESTIEDGEDQASSSALHKVKRSPGTRRH